jgi:hypothetical protein
MRDANGGTKMNTRVVENLELTIAGISVFVHAWIIEKVPYRLLLGQPFQVTAQCDTEDVGEMLIIFDPKKPGRRMRVPLTPHHTGEHRQTNLMLTTPSLISATLLEPVRAGSPGPKWTEARMIGLRLQLMCCARSVVQPWISGTDIGRRPKLRNANEETWGYSS